jgi:pimeloyl-ACP methyl ester carboxylesterase
MGPSGNSSFRFTLSVGAAERDTVLAEPTTDVAFASVELSTGAELRISGGDGLLAVVCMNGGQSAEVEGTWSASVEWLVAKLIPRLPEVRFAELRYRVKSWRRLPLCVEDARAAIEAVGGERIFLLGFSMGGAVAIEAASEPSVEKVVGLAPWIPPQLPLEGLRGRRFSVIHGNLDRYFPGIPGVSSRHSRAGFERARTLGVEGDYTLIPGAVHGVAVRPFGLGLVPLPRAKRWVELVAAEIERG